MSIITSITAADIARELGGRRSGRGWIARCPAHQDRNPSFSISEGVDGRTLVHCFAGCDQESVIDALRARGLWSAGDGECHHHHDLGRRQHRDRHDDGQDYQRQKARFLWRTSQPAAGTIAEVYLRSARGITCALPSTVRFLPPSKPGHHPAMIVAYGLPEEPEPGVLDISESAITATQLTLLLPDGSGKAKVEKPKITIASPSGKPMVLAPISDALALCIVEGVEEALTAHCANGCGGWAAGGGGNMPKLAPAVPDFTEVVTIVADADATGQNGARRLANALRERGIPEVLTEGLRDDD